MAVSYTGFEMYAGRLAQEMLLSQDVVQSAIEQGPQAMVQLPSGEQVPVRSLVVPPIKGRKVVLLGDTCDSQAILSAFLPCPSPSLLSVYVTTFKKPPAQKRYLWCHLSRAARWCSWETPVCHGPISVRSHLFSTL